MDCDICKRIKENRMRMGMTQSELGLKIGVQKSAIQKYESGNNHYKLETIIKLAHAFEISVSTLIGEEPTEGDMRENFYRMYGVKGVAIVEAFESLNDIGRVKVLAYARDILPNYSVNIPVREKGDGI